MGDQDMFEFDVTVDINNSDEGRIAFSRVTYTIVASSEEEATGEVIDYAADSEGGEVTVYKVINKGSVWFEEE